MSFSFFFFKFYTCLLSDLQGAYLLLCYASLTLIKNFVLISLFQESKSSRRAGSDKRRTSNCPGGGGSGRPR